MAFWLKKTIAFCLMPVPACLGLMLAGLVLLRLPGRRPAGRGLLGAGVLLLLLCSNDGISRRLIGPLEARYAALPDFTGDGPLPPALARCRYVVVLGGGHGEAKGLSANNRLSSSALERIVEGVRLSRLLPDARLVVSGPPERQPPSHAAILARTARALGIAPARILEIDTARDTEAEAAAVRILAGDAPVALVTSAWHLPRAERLFRRAGVDALPCPCDFLVRDAGGWNWGLLLCSAESLNRSTLALHEWLGLLWLHLRGAGEAGAK